MDREIFQFVQWLSIIIVGL